MSRIVLTELRDILQPGTIVQDDDGQLWARDSRGWFELRKAGFSRTPPRLPLTLIHDPEETK